MSRRKTHYEIDPSVPELIITRFETAWHTGRFRHYAHTLQGTIASRRAGVGLEHIKTADDFARALTARRDSKFLQFKRRGALGSTRPPTPLKGNFSSVIRSVTAIPIAKTTIRNLAPGDSALVSTGRREELERIVNGRFVRH